MTMTINSDELPQREIAEPPAATRRSGSAALVFVVALAVVATAVAFMLLGRAQAQPYILGLLALLAMVGLFMAFAFAAGIVQFADRSATDPIIRKVADGAFDGVVVTDQRGHIAYANPAYLALTGAATPAEARAVERVFIGDPEVSETVYRLLKAARFAITNPSDRSGWDHLEDALEPWGKQLSEEIPIVFNKGDEIKVTVEKVMSEAEQAELAEAREIVSKVVIPPADEEPVNLGRSPDWALLEDGARALHSLEDGAIAQWLKLTEEEKHIYRRRSAVCLGAFRAFDSKVPAGLYCSVAFKRCDNPDCRIMGCRKRAEMEKDAKRDIA